ncbi:MAG: hypothetical protein K2Y25_16295 [Pseudomonadaceae bacterium]|jgi:hypothetical protein|nr:hypothetical protein [Pseudomonadaceae bacterium]
MRLMSVTVDREKQPARGQRLNHGLLAVLLGLTPQRQLYPSPALLCDAQGPAMRR